MSLDLCDLSLCIDLCDLSLDLCDWSLKGIIDLSEETRLRSPHISEDFQTLPFWLKDIIERSQENRL